MNYPQVPISAVASFINGFPFKPDDWGHEGYPIIRIQNLTDPKKVSNRTNKKVPDKYLVTKGDILVSWSATIDIFEWDREDSLLNQHIFKVVFDYKRIDKEFFKLAIRKTIEELSKFAHGATMKHIIKGDFDKHKIPLPPLDDQKRIAHLLGNVERMIAQRKQHLQHLDDLLKSVFLDMFGDPVRNEKGWKKRPFDDLLLGIESGSSPKCEARVAEQGEWGILKLGAVTGCVFKEGENKALPHDVKPQMKDEVRKGDLLFSRKNTYELVAACVYVFDTRPKLLLPDLIFRFVFKNDAKINPIYMWKLLTSSSQRAKIQTLASGAAGSMPNISKANLRKASLPVPPFELQNQFAAIVEKVEGLKSRYQQSLTDLQNVYDALSQKAFKGELDLSRVKGMHLAF
jgi:type I restriction enzyme S subunit